jgi:hypothetical protein
MQVTIKSASLRQETTNKGTVLQKQQAAVETGRDFPLVFELTVREAYPPGRYELAPESYRVSRFGGLEIDPYGIALRPLK